MVDATVADTGADPFTMMSGRDGGPLARTVKCIIDPLVLRLRANPDYGKPLLDADQARDVGNLIGAAAPTLADAARWFTELKAQRRTAGITGGNIQEQYFPRAFELAVSYGTPADDASSIAAEMIVDIHQPSAGMSVDDLTDYLDAGHDRLAAALDAVWTSTTQAPVGRPPADSSETVAALLSDDVDARVRDLHWKELTASNLPAAVGLDLFDTGTSITELLAACEIRVPESVRAPSLSAVVPATAPPLRGRAAGLPLDRSIATRVATTLRRSRDREQLPPIADLVDDEITRSRAPWALDGAVWQAAALVGVIVAAQLYPLAPQASPHGFVTAMTQRLAAQAHILYNRRFLLDGSDSDLATDLREFWRPYLSRLWVRLHGRSIGEPDTPATRFDAAALLDLLDGIARSVSYDQRSRIRAVIEKAAR